MQARLPRITLRAICKSSKNHLPRGYCYMEWKLEARMIYHNSGRVDSKERRSASPTVNTVPHLMRRMWWGWWGRVWGWSLQERGHQPYWKLNNSICSFMRKEEKSKNKKRCVVAHRLMHHIPSGGSAARLTQAHHHLSIIVTSMQIGFLNPQIELIVWIPRREGRGWGL